MRLRISLCGRLEVERGGERIEGRLPGLQGPLVLALLVLNRARPVARHELIGALWPRELPADPDEALSALLSKVRQAVGRDMLTGRRELTLVLPADVEIDVEQAFAASELAQSAIAGGDWPTAWEAGSTAVEITGRGFLVGHDAPWVEDRRGELEEVWLRALETVAEAGVALGGAHVAGADRAARELTRAAPLREAGHRLLMEALAARGEVPGALAAYEELRVLLRDELGMAPGEAVRALHERLLAGESDRSRPVATPEPVPVPLPALLSRMRGGLVGREQELERLREAWADARSGRRRLVLLCGGPGIGKTRLAGELAREAHADGTVLYAGCEEDALVSYQPFVEVLRYYVRNASLDGALSRLGPGGLELARLIPELAEQMPQDGGASPDDPETRRYLMLEAVSSLLTEACDRAPVLLVLDDLHWADRSTLKLLRHVVRAQHEASLLILGTYRDVDVAPEHPLADLLADLRRDSLFERVSLEGLDRSSVGALVASHAGQTAPSALVQTVHSETEGNPFFVEEVVRHLIETGVVFERGGRWRSALKPDEIGVPEGVKEVLGRRLARLSETCRGVLSQAAVLGRAFRFDLLLAMAGTGEESVIGALEEALGARLAVEEGGSFAFTHALVRETLYGALSAPRRQRMHALAARAIEGAQASDPDGQVAALAVHYRLAGPAADPAKAVSYSLRAGERARQLFAWDEASAHWDGALEPMERAGADPAERGRLLLALAEVCAVVGDLARQIGYLELARGLYTGMGDEQRTAQVHSRLGMAYSLIDSIDAEHLDIGRAFDHFESARTVLERGPVSRARGHLETGVATALTYGVRVEPGIEAAGRAMEIAQEVGDEALWAGAAQAYGWHKVVAGELREGFATVERAFEAADRGQWPFLAWMGSNIGGQLTWGLGDPDGAQPFFERVLGLPYAGETAYRQEIADGVGRCHASRGELEPARIMLSDARSAWITHSLQAQLDLWEGKWEQVEALARRTLETSRRTGNRWDEWGSHHLAARVLHLRGEPERAAGSLERARRIVDEGGARYFQLWVLPDLARAKAETGHLDEARRHVDRCRQIVGGGEDWRGRQGIADVAEAVVLSFEERPDEADARFEAALEMLARFRLPADEADGLHQWGLALARVGERFRAAEKLEAAADIYRQHGAGAAWLKRIEADARRHD